MNQILREKGQIDSQTIGKTTIRLLNYKKITIVSLNLLT